MSGKKKLCLDSKVLLSSQSKSTNIFKSSFQIDKIKCEIVQIKDKPFSYIFKIANRNFIDLLKDQNSGRLKKIKEEYLKKEKEKKQQEKEKKIKEEKEKQDEYDKRAKAFNNEINAENLFIDDEDSKANIDNLNDDSKTFNNNKKYHK